LIRTPRRHAVAAEKSGSVVVAFGNLTQAKARRSAVIVAGVVASVAVVLSMESPTPMIGHLVMVVALVPLVIIDLEDHRLPREISYPAAALSAAVLLVGDLMTSGSHWLGVVVGGLAMTGLLGGFSLVSRGGLGAGDVRLGPLLGVNIGYHAVVGVVVAVWVAAALALLLAVPVLIARRRSRIVAVAFGPFLAAGSFAAIALYAI